MRTKLLGLLLTAALALPPTAFAADNELTGEEKAEGWQLLFNGKDLDNWITNRRTPPRTEVENGTFNPRRAGGYLIMPDAMYTDYILSLDYKCSPGANSGIFLRQFPLKPPKGLMIYECGIEVQILDILETPMHDSGAIYDLVPAAVDARNPTGEWNTMVITADGPNISVVFNGQHVAAINLDEFTEKNKRADGSEHKFNVAFADHPRTGYIGFQDHGDDVWFKNVKIKTLNGTEAEYEKD